MAQVLLNEIEKSYGDVQVVRKLSLQVAAGEFLVLVGASGCGKSTTLRMVAGLESITSGELRIGERVVNDVPPRDRDIAMVFQSYALYPHMTVYDNMAFGLTLRKVPKAEIATRVRHAAAMLGLDTLLDRKPAALSGGQRQRVAMGRAVVRQPAVFLFDEPLSNLDAKLRVQMRLEIAKLHKRLQATILYVTHDQVEAMTLADRIAVMHQGVLQQCASPHEIYATPVNTYVATFIGSPAMNLLPVAVTQDASGWQLTGSGLTLQLGPQEHNLPSTLTVGVRPQDWRRAQATEAIHARLRVEVVEPLGAETNVFGVLVDAIAVPIADKTAQQRQESATIWRSDPSDRVGDGDEIALHITRFHLFSADGQRL